MSSKAVPVEEDTSITSISIRFMFATTGSRACTRVPKHQPFLGRTFLIVLHLLLKLPGYAGSQSHSWGPNLCHSSQSPCTLIGCFLKCLANMEDLYNSHEPEFAYVNLFFARCVVSQHNWRRKLKIHFKRYWSCRAFASPLDFTALFR